VPLYNIEVDGEHVYEVTALGILVHNTTPLCEELLHLRNLANAGKLTPELAPRLSVLEAEAAAILRSEMAAVQALGRAGENGAGIVQNTQRIPSLSGTAAYRTPDGLRGGALIEVKNVGRLSFTAQLRDSLHYAIMTGRDMILWVRPGTILSPSLQRAIREGWIQVRFL